MRVLMTAAVLAAAAVALLASSFLPGAPLLTSLLRDDLRVALSDLPWLRAHAGRAVLISEGLPVRDASLAGNPLQLGGVVYERGLGVGGGSELVYALHGQYQRFEALAGLTEDSPGDSPALRFLVFLDDILAFDSGLLRPGDGPRPVVLETTGVEHLRLATQGVEGYGAWADAWLSLSDPSGPPLESSPALTRLLTERRQRAEARARDRSVLDETAAAERRRLALLIGWEAVEAAGQVHAASALGQIALTNGQLGVLLSAAGGEPARLTVLDLAAGRLVLYRVAPSVELESGGRYLLTDALPVLDAPPQIRELDEPGFGPGKEVLVRFRSRDGLLDFWIALQLFERHPALLYRIGVAGAPDARAAFLFFDPAAGGSLVVGEDAYYLTDFNRLRWGGLPDDGLLREERVGHGKPVWVWSAQDATGLLLAAIDDTAASPFVTLRRDPGQSGAQIAFGSGPITPGFPSHTGTGDQSPLPLPVWEAEGGRGVGAGLVSPRLYIEATHTAHLHDAFAGFRAAMAVLYPPLPLPDWVRHQWLSWYVYGFEINEDVLRRQLDAIASDLSGLGPWHLLVDAGWYVGEGRPDADWRNVDRAKFPHGLGAFVDEARRRGVKTVLYFGAPYLNTEETPGNWMGLTGLAREHPDWLIFGGTDEFGEHYLMDFSKPELRAYVRDVMEDFFSEYGVAGLKLDGLGSAEGDLPLVEAGPAWVLDPIAAGQTMDIYRFLHKAANAAGDAPYLESGWSNPVFAHPYSHTFRYGDEADAFSHPYPGGGLVEHIDYAAYQAALGQPANMGAILGDPTRFALPRWWLGAALAMGNQVAFSFDLTALDRGARNHLRALMAHYHPFAGRTIFDGKLTPEVFATTNGPLTYLGVLNREAGPRTFTIGLAQYGVASGQSVTVYDVEAGQFFRVDDGQVTVDADGESFRLLILRTTPGVLWTTSGFHEWPGDGRLTVLLDGPTSDEGLVQLATPRPTTVLLDWTAIAEDESVQPGRWSYDAGTGILSVGLPPGGQRVLVVRWDSPLTGDAALR